MMAIIQQHFYKYYSLQCKFEQIITRPLIFNFNKLVFLFNQISHIAIKLKCKNKPNAIFRRICLLTKLFTLKVNKKRAKTLIA